MRIAIMGYSGSGKTYLANEIAKFKQIPILQLDAVQYTKDWTAIDKKVALKQVSDFMKQDDWIIEGHGTDLLLNERLNNADIIILMFFPRIQCLWRVIKRRKQRIAGGHTNDTNMKFIRFVLFGCRSKRRREEYHKIIENYKCKTVVLKNKKSFDKLYTVLQNLE